MTCGTGETCANGVCSVTDPIAKGNDLFMQWGCVACHSADATGGIGPNIQGKPASIIFSKLQGNSHPITIPNVTMQDAQYIEAWLGSL